MCAVVRDRVDRWIEGGSWFAEAGVFRSVSQSVGELRNCLGRRIQTDMQPLLTDYDLIA